MTSTVVRMGEGHEFPGRVKEIVISCDHEGCSTALDDTTIRAGGGLKNMGWEAPFIDHKLNHYCPEHRRTKE